MTSFQTIPIELLYVSDKNVRKNMISNQKEESNLDTLTRDINKNGLINPISVRKVNDKYEIYAGQRRFNAIQSLKWKEVPCSVCTYDENRIEEISLSENIQRNRMSYQDKCNAFHKFYKMNNDNFQTVANITSLSIKTVTNYITIKNKLNPVLIPFLDKWGEERLSIETALNIIENVKNIDEHPEVFEKLKKFKNDMEKKDYLMNLNKKKPEDNKDKKEKEKKQKIPDVPWIPDLNNKKERIIIPDKYYKEIYNMITNN